MDLHYGEVIQSYPVVTDGLSDVGSDEGNLYAIEKYLKPTPPTASPSPPAVSSPLTKVPSSQHA